MSENNPENMAKKKIAFTGGGTTGHVSLNLVLIPLFLTDGWEVFYVGSKTGMEKQLIGEINNVHYVSVNTGKFRRYFSWRNIKDIFLIIAGIWQAFWFFRKEKVAVLFSKGGFVSFPVIVGGWLNGVPILLHESDMTPGLANRLSLPFASVVLTTFEETKVGSWSKKVKYIGPIIRKEVGYGKVEEGAVLTGFDRQRPILLVMGGSLGAQKINQAIRDNLEKLLLDFQVIHLCGKGQVEKKFSKPGYVQFEYVNRELPSLLAMADIVVSRAGANAIFEFLFLRKPMVLIPLPLVSSRGDQLENANFFQKKGYGEIIEDAELFESGRLLEVVGRVWKNRQSYLRQMEKAKIENDHGKLFALVKDVAKGGEKG